MMKSDLQKLISLSVLAALLYPGLELSSGNSAYGLIRAKLKTSAQAAQTRPTAPAIPEADTASREVQAMANDEPWRKNAPSMPPPRPFTLPKIESYKLANGLEIQLVEDHRFPIISANLGFRSGSAADPPDELGISDMTADMLTEGTANRTSRDIATEVDFIGGGLTAACDYDYTVLSGSALSPYKDRLFNLMAEVLLKPSFPESELSLKKVNLIQELTIKRGDPDFLVEERFNKTVYGSHPYSVVAPTEAAINKISRKDLQAWHDTHYQPNRSVLIVIGDFQPDKIKAEIESKFGAWKALDVHLADQPSPPKQEGRRIYLVDRPGSVQTSIKVGNLGIKRNDPDYFPMVVMNQILGGAAHARLFLNIREAKGFTYGAYSRVAARKNAGSFFATANVRTDVTNPSLQEFLYELDRIRTTKVTDEEIKSAKNYLAGSFQLGLETQGGLAQRLLEAKLYDLPDNYLETYAEKITQVNVDDVRKAAGRLIDSNNLVIAVVGDGKKIEKDLELFAPVTIYDAQGKLSTDALPAASKDSLN
jgi:zinc protease